MPGRSSIHRILLWCRERSTPCCAHTRSSSPVPMDNVAASSVDLNTSPVICPARSPSRRIDDASALDWLALLTAPPPVLHVYGGETQYIDNHTVMPIRQQCVWCFLGLVHCWQLQSVHRTALRGACSSAGLSCSQQSKKAQSPQLASLQSSPFSLLFGFHHCSHPSSSPSKRSWTTKDETATYVNICFQCCRDAEYSRRYFG